MLGLVSRKRLTAEEEARFITQCDCVENLDAAQDTSTCAEKQEDH